MSAIRDLFTSDGIINLLISLPVVLIALMVHEVAHGFIAYKLGDPTARNLGRLSLNPLKHLDPFGTLCMIFFHFGWAKPVPINSRYFKKPRRDIALTALAGPVSNIILAFIGTFLLVLVNHFVPKLAGVNNVDFNFVVSLYGTCLQFFYYFVYLNITLAIFNLIPVPPLDGSRIFYVFLKPKWYFGIMKYERYIMFALMLCLITGIVSLPLGALSDLIFNGMLSIVRFILPIG